MSYDNSDFNQNVLVILVKSGKLRKEDLYDAIKEEFEIAKSNNRAFCSCVSIGEMVSDFEEALKEQY
jgi:hypothetical protein